MPVKYKLRPLSAVSDSLDTFSYNFMLQKYMDNTLKVGFPIGGLNPSSKLLGGGANSTEADDSEPAKLKPGESTLTGLRHKGSGVAIGKTGTLTLTTKDGMVLWDSLSADWGCTSRNDCRCKTFAPPYVLKYENNGDLTLKDNTGKMLWHSLTDLNTCDGDTAGYVKFENGQLSIHNSAGDKQWTTATLKGLSKQPSRAVRSMFGDGDNKCIKKKPEKCFSIYADYNYAGKVKHMIPGDYTKTSGPKTLAYPKGDTLLEPETWYGYDYSIKTGAGRCWGEVFNGYDFDTTRITYAQAKIPDTYYYKDIQGVTCTDPVSRAGLFSVRVHTTSNYQLYQAEGLWSTCSSTKCRKALTIGYQTSKNVKKRKAVLDDIFNV